MIDTTRALVPSVLALLFAAGGCGRVSPQCDPAWYPGGRDRVVLLADRTPAPLVLVPLGVTGAPCDANAANTLAERLRGQNYTDVYFICPGWHDRWESAVDWAKSFAEGYERARQWAPRQPAATKPAYKPLYVAVLWPTSVQNPVYPAFDSSRDAKLRPDVDRVARRWVIEDEVSPEVIERIVLALRSRGHDVRASRLELLAQRYSTITPPEQIDLADCLLPLYGPQGEPSAPGLRYALAAGQPEVARSFAPTVSAVVLREPSPLPPLSADDLLQTWKDSLRSMEPEAAARSGSNPTVNVAELFRWAMRATDLRVIKDRAYLAGVGGCAELITAARESSTARIHLVGHSFGAETVLAAANVVATSPGMSAPPATAAATAPATPSPAAIHSVLLLSPLVNHHALSAAPPIAMDVPRSLQSKARPGAFYEVATSREVRSVVVVSSTRDWFAGEYARVALRRPAFKGMASPDSWSSPGQGFATLGAVGPGGAEPSVQREPLIAPGAGPEGPQPYLFPAAATKLVAIDASDAITVHGDANDRAIWWLFANQVGE